MAALKVQKKSLSVAESCTGGMLAAAITDVPGASDVFPCGVVSYAVEMKEELLKVAHDTIKTYGVVSKEVALEMARGVRNLAKTTYGIGVTGVAGPGPDGTHPEGDIYIALVGGAEERVTHLMTGTHNERQKNRQAAVDAALHLLITEVENG